MAETPGRVAATLAEIRERRYRKGTAPGLMAGWLADRAAEDIPRLLAAVEAALKLHRPKPVYGLAFALNSGKPLCAHDPDSDHDAHFEGDDGLWYCRDEITGRACVTCAEEDAADLWAEWPCPTYLAIGAALTGTQPSEDGSDRA